MGLGRRRGNEHTRALGLLESGLDDDGRREIWDLPGA